MLPNTTGENTVGMRVRDAATLVTSANKHGNTRTESSVIVSASSERANRQHRIFDQKLRREKEIFAKRIIYRCLRISVLRIKTEKEWRKRELQ